MARTLFDAGDVQSPAQVQPVYVRDEISWKKLSEHFEQMKSVHMRSLFAEDPNRFEKFSLRFNDILVDYSKNIITEETKELLIRGSLN